MDEIIDSVKQVIKKFFKTFIKYAIVICLISALLAGAIYFITLSDGTYKEGDMSNTPYAASTYISSTKFTDNGIIFVRKEEQTGQEVELTSKDMAEYLWQEMLNNQSNVKDYLDSAEELEKLMNAEIITQYPRLNSVNSNGLNGTVEFKRHRSDGTEVMLKYMSKELFNYYLSVNNTIIDEYYTLDEHENLVIAIDSSITESLIYTDPDVSISDYSNTITTDDRQDGNIYSRTTHNYTSKTLNYKSAISKYTMPFQYLWSLIVVGEDKKVGLDIAELVNNSQIVISIYDNITTTTESSYYTYDREKKVEVSAKASASTNAGEKTKKSSEVSDWPNPASTWTEDSYVVSHVYIYKENTPMIDVTKANVWIVDYSKNYRYDGTEDISYEENEKTLNNTEYVLESSNTSNLGNGTDLLKYDEFSYALSDLISELEDDIDDELVFGGIVNGVIKYDEIIVYSTGISSCSANYYKHNANITEKDVRFVKRQKYVSEIPVNNPKIQKKTEEQIKNGTGPNNFVTILCDSGHMLARNKICYDYTDWLIELLENNPDTANMVDLTKYLMYVITNNDRYGIREYDFTQYNPDGFMTYSSGVYTGTIQEKVWYMLKDLGISDIAAAGAMGNIHYESGTFDPTKVEGGYNENNGGIGLCQWTNNKRGDTGRNANLKAYAGSKGWQDEDTQVEFLRAELSGGGLNGYASNQLLDRRTFYGESVAYGDGWKNATTIEDATKAFCYSFERPRAEDARNSMNTRVAYAKKYYDEFAGKERSGGEFSTVSSSQYIIGKFTSSITGKTFTIFNQTKIPNWSNKCNRAAQSSVCSGYYSENPVNIISMAEGTCPRYGQLYSMNGLTWENGNTNLTPEIIKGRLQNKGYIIPYLKGAEVGASGISKYRKKMGQCNALGCNIRI